VFKELWKSESKQINKWRTETLKLPPITNGRLDVIKSKRITVVNAYPTIIIPGQRRPSDWPDHLVITGPCFPPPGIFPLKPELEEFMKTADEPIYFGIGSMPAPDPKLLLSNVAKTLKSLNKKGVIVAGWTEITEELKQEIFGENPQVIIVDSAPHDWLLPRCSVIVHHGGMGTSLAALRSGKPSVCIPVYLDQPFLAQRLQEIGVAPNPIPYGKLTPGLLTAAIVEVFNSKAIRGKAQALAAQIVDGTLKAAEEVLKTARASPKFL